MPKVLVSPMVLYGVRGPFYDVLEAAGLEVVFPPPGEALANPEVLIRRLEGISAVLASIEPYTPEVLAASRFRVIARMGVGYDAIDVAAATSTGVVVTYAPGTNDVSVAELTIALILGVSRGFPGRYHEVKNGKWRRKALPRLAGQTLGLAGLGRIGKAVTPRAQGLGLKVIAYDPFPDRKFAEEHDVQLVGFDQLLEQADIVSLHLPGTPETRDLINARSLAKMKRGAMLINTARGALVDEDALVAALKSGHLMGAGLDVFKVEPLPLDSPLLALDNVLLCPHMGGLDLESEIAMSRLAAQCIADLYQGRWPEPCVVNPQLKQGWKW